MFMVNDITIHDELFMLVWNLPCGHVYGLSRDYSIQRISPQQSKRMHGLKYLFVKLIRLYTNTRIQDVHLNLKASYLDLML
jgi:hypothetical protein